MTTNRMTTTDIINALIADINADTAASLNETYDAIFSIDHDATMMDFAEMIIDDCRDDDDIIDALQLDNDDRFNQYAAIMRDDNLMIRNALILALNAIIDRA